jgi:hypothetical protein
MKLPFIDLKKIEQIKPNKHMIHLKPNIFLNYLAIDRIASKVDNKSIETVPHSFNDTQRYIKDLYLKREIQERIKKNKKYSLKNNISLNKHNNSNNQNNISLNKSNNIKTQINSNYHNNNNNNKSINVYENIDYHNNEIKYIKKTFSSNKIKKVISSFLFSSPKNQIKFINCIMNKSEKKKIIDKSIQKLKYPRKIKKKNIRLYLEENEKDEDKIIFKDRSLFTLFSPKEKHKYKDKKKIKSFRCWNNQLLKSLLPENIKNYYEYHKPQKEVKNVSKLKRTKVMYFRNDGYKTISSIINKKINSSEKHKKLKIMMLNKDKEKNGDNSNTINNDKSTKRKLSRSTLVY